MPVFYESKKNNLREGESREKSEKRAEGCFCRRIREKQGMRKI
jgi:hypothetical protein